MLDLPAAQLLLGREGLVEAIDVQIAPDRSLDEVRAALAERVAHHATVSTAGARSEEYRSLVRNVRLTLGVPSVMAIVVGALVIHHAVAVAVSRRRSEIALLRALGATRAAVTGVFLAEGLAIGVLGTAFGIGLGFLLAHAANGIVLATIAGVYRPLATTTLEVSPLHVAIGAALGVLLTAFAYASAARDAAPLTSGVHTASPRRARWRAARVRAAWGALLVPLGIWLGAQQQAGIDGERLAAVATGSDALILLGFGLFVPVVIGAAARRLGRHFSGSRLVLARLGFQGLTGDPGRSAMAITSVAIGAAYVMITVGPIGSLSGAVNDWIAKAHTSDLIVAAPGSLGFFPTAPPIPGALAARLAGEPSVARVEPLRLVTQPFGGRWVVVAARNPEAIGTVNPVEVQAGDLARARDGLRAGTGTIVSHHFAEQHELALGDLVSLRSPTGAVELRIDAIVTDFASADVGTLFVTPAMLRERWRDFDVTNFQVWLRPGADPALARDSLAAALGGDASVLSRDDFVERSSGVIDAVFTMAYALEVVAALVIVVAVASFFSMTIRERRIEIEQLRTVGATPAQIRGAFSWEAAAIGTIGSAVGIAIGLPLAMRMTETTIRLGGGFALDFRLPPTTLALVVLGAVALCTACARFELWATAGASRALARASGA